MAELPSREGIYTSREKNNTILRMVKHMNLEYWRVGHRKLGEVKLRCFTERERERERERELKICDPRLDMHYAAT